MSEENSFSERFSECIGGKYSPAMRRSVQTVVLYEANRCLKDRYSALRPFQRKIALYDTAVDLINTLDIIPSHLRSEIMYRTASGKLPLSADLAWRRMRLIDREIMKTIVPKIRPFCEDPEKDHKTSCAEFIQDQYEIVSGVKGKKHPVVWEFSHLNIFLAYKMYYEKGELNETLPPARDPDPNRVVPNKKPPNGEYPPGASMRGGDDDDESADEGKKGATVRSRASEKGAKSKALVSPADERRALLQEVRDHLELLKEFEGVISPAEMSKRKKDLFMSLPSAPSSARKDKSKKRPSLNGKTPPVKKAKSEDSDDDDADEEEDDDMLQNALI